MYDGYGKKTKSTFKINEARRFSTLPWIYQIVGLVVTNPKVRTHKVVQLYLKINEGNPGSNVIAYRQITSEEKGCVNSI